MIKITAKRDGFRRCGVAHTKEATLHPDKRFTADQLELLKAEPMLVVEVLAGGEGKAGDDKRLNATDTIALVKATETIEGLDKLAVDEDRKSVLDAIAKRRTELETPA